MSRRTKWIVAAAAALLGASPAAAQYHMGGTANYSAPVNEVPLPLMWDQNRDEGFYFSAEATVMRMNNALRGQIVARRGFRDYDGSIRGNTDGGIINVFDTQTPPAYYTTLFREKGPAGAIYGTGEAALSTDQLNTDVFQPGTRLTVGYRLRNGISIEATYMGITKARQNAFAGITPPNGDVTQIGDNGFLFGDYFNFSPYYSGPNREIISNVYLDTIPPGTGTDIFITPVPADLQTLRGFAVPAYGITNGAEVWSISHLMSIHTSELNMRVPVAQFEGTRTYWTGGFRYLSFTERFRMLVEDQGFPDNLNTGSPLNAGVIDSESRPEWSLRYTVKQKDIFYGLQTGVGGEAYLFNGFAVSLDGKIGVLAQHARTTTVLQRLDFENGIGIKRTDNKFNLATMFQGGAYLWWYAHEGITFRVGYEYLGVVGARRMAEPIDYNWGNLAPKARNSYLSLDGFVAGVSFVF